MISLLYRYSKSVMRHNFHYKTLANGNGQSRLVHSSPSFGSQQAHSNSIPPTTWIGSVDDAPLDAALASAPSRGNLHFHFAGGFATQRLAGMLHSLVRVSRRDEWSHVLPTARRSCALPPQSKAHASSTACSPASRDWTSEKGASLERPASSRLRVIVTSVADFRRRGATRSSLLRGGGSLPPQPVVDTDQCRWQEPRRSADVR